MAAKDAAFAQFMVAINCQQPVAKSVLEFFQAFSHTLIGCLVTHADKSGIAGKISVGDHIIKFTALFQEPIKQVILVQWPVHPKKPAVQGNALTQYRVWDHSKFIIVAPGAFSGPRIMDIAEDSEPNSSSHWSAQQARLAPLIGSRQQRQVHPERGSFAWFALGLDTAVMLFKNPFSHSQTQTRATGFGGKKRFK